ncbi:hypothetical protein J3R82DRAFT_1655 [Butyriboletus roseoflavus]|nr:hypothetical protein J3R82DRAFT_1655 [Butyriboletus roseoflavus]
MLHDEIATLHEAQGQNTKDMKEIHTGLQSLSSMVTEVIGRLETINLNMASLSDMKPVVAGNPITEKKHWSKQSATNGEDSGVTFRNERDNVWNVNETAICQCFPKAIWIHVPYEINMFHPHPNRAQIKDNQIRPDFTKDWGDNSPWHALMVTYIMNNIQSVQPMITAKLFEEKKADIFGHLHKVFKHYAKEYRDSNGITLTYGGAKLKGKSSAQMLCQDARK